MCTKQVSYFVASGFLYREVFVQCGRTDPHGGRALCDECASDKARRDEHRRILANSEADNAALRSAGWGEI